jgi:hypothetical protein
MFVITSHFVLLFPLLSSPVFYPILPRENIKLHYSYLRQLLPKCYPLKLISNRVFFNSTDFFRAGDYYINKQQSVQLRKTMNFRRRFETAAHL